jgi:hypothetical protein
VFAHIPGEGHNSIVLVRAGRVKDPFHIGRALFVLTFFSFSVGMPDLSMVLRGLNKEMRFLRRNRIEEIHYLFSLYPLNQQKLITLY